MYAITGATGQLGRLAIDSLLKTVPADQVVAIVRSPDKAADLAARGVVVREGDYDRPETLVAALAGVDKLLFISASEIGRRLPQHRAIVDAAKAQGVSLIAYTSVLHADNNPLQLAEEHRQTEAMLKASGIPHVVLRNGWYSENCTASIPAALQHGAVMGAARDGQFSAATRADFADAAVVVLTQAGHAGQVYELAGDTAFTQTQFAAALSEAAGKTIVYNNLAPAAYQQLLEQVGLPTPLAAMLADSDDKAADGAMFDGSGTLGRLIGRPTTPIADTIATTLAALSAEAV